MAKKDWLACVLIGKEESGDKVGGDGGGGNVEKHLRFSMMM